LTAVAQLESSKAPIAAQPRIGGRYQILEQIGTGGMGAVYRAQDEARQCQVALKQLKVQPGDRHARLIKALFEREFHTLSRLKHPRIIEVYDYGVSDDGPYYTMELLSGGDLQGLSPLPYREACRLLRDVASSLALIHAHRLVHRDVSPRNVRLTADARAKLIDFGALAAFGIANEVIGTPTCIAPETLQRLPLDQRTDLFSLGAVAYSALTGRPAYPARQLRELPSLWQVAPQPPSALRADIPPRLDALVLSLLNIDPLARPANAAAVIDELTLIAELEPEEDNTQAAESYLQSSRIVGRDSEREWMLRRMQRALDGRGSEVILEGPSGIGRTRLLREIAVTAQLQGIVPLRVDACAVPMAYGVAIELGSQLLQMCPEIAREAADEHAALLGHLSPELHDKLGASELSALPEDLNERRARFQTALHAWFTAVGRKLPLLVAVDNLQAADHDSAAFLAGIGRSTRESRMLLVVTQRSDQTVLAPAPVRAMRKQSAMLKLAGLNAVACEELVKSLFGDVANTGRMARLLHERSAGNPGQCMELARLLVRNQIVRYVAGTWLLPLEVSAAELPTRMEEVLVARLGALSPEARALCDALSLHAKPVPLERLLALVDNTDSERCYAALDELVSEQIVLVDQGQYRFEQPALRDALLAQMEETKRKTLHRRAATLLLESGASAGTRVEAAWHLLHGGDEVRGADLLAEAGREFTRSQTAIQDGYEQVVHALETALAVYERQKRSDYELAALMCMLVPTAFFIDRRIALTYGERALQLGMKITGLGLAQKLRPYLGRPLALSLSLMLAGIRFAIQRKRGLNYGLVEAIKALCGLAPATVGTFNICYDMPAVKRLVREFAPLRLLGEERPAALMHDHGIGMLRMGQGREADALEHMLRTRERFCKPDVIEVMGKSPWNAIYGSVVFSVGMLYAYTSGTRALDCANDMDALDVRLWSMMADQLRMLHHALRGEVEPVAHYRERVELFAVQGGTTWQAEMFWPVLLYGAEALCKDTMAMRRVWEQLSRRARETSTLEVYADAAQAAYLSMRADHKAAITLYERILPQLPLRERVAWSSIRAHAAEAFNAAGQHARAKQLALEVLNGARPEDHAMLGRFLEPKRQLALAEAGLGNHAEAVRILDELLAKHAHDDQPLLVGLLHKARAEVALEMNDRAQFEAQTQLMERHFRATKNPALITQWERLNQRAQRSGLTRVDDFRAAPPVDDASSNITQRRIFSELSSAKDPYDFALRLLVEESRASAGYLYLYHHRGMHPAAATSNEEPQRELEAELTLRAQRIELREAEDADSNTQALDDCEPAAPEQSAVRPLQANAATSADQLPATRVERRAAQPGADASMADDEPVTQFVASEPAPNLKTPYRSFLLSTSVNGRTVIVGGVIVKATATGGQGIDSGILDSIARTLYDRQSSVVG
jgi:hypothetical protein